MFTQDIRQLSVVDLLRWYSNIPPLPIVLKSPTTGVAPQRPPRPRRRTLQIEPVLLDQLVSDYQAGISAERLSRRYNLSKGTVLKHLHELGVLRPRRRLTQTQKEQAATLYSQGPARRTASSPLLAAAEVRLEPTWP